MKITEAELLDALATSTRGNTVTEARTMQEIAQDTGISLGLVRRALRSAQADGRLQTHRMLRRTLTGSHTTVTGFTITPAKKKKRTA